jgi:hypothetical protein
VARRVRRIRRHAAGRPDPIARSARLVMLAGLASISASFSRAGPLPLTALVTRVRAWPAARRDSPARSRCAWRSRSSWRLWGDPDRRRIGCTDTSARPTCGSREPEGAPSPGSRRCRGRSRMDLHAARLPAGRAQWRVVDRADLFARPADAHGRDEAREWTVRAVRGHARCSPVSRCSRRMRSRPPARAVRQPGSPVRGFHRHEPDRRRHDGTARPTCRS